MWVAASNALALMRWNDLRFFQDFNGRDIAGLLIGVLLAAVTIAVILRRRRRWF